MKLRSGLIDSFGRVHGYLRISLTERCNLRCTYCMPDKGVLLTPDHRLMTDEEIVRISKVFIRHGVKKIRLTGGEPLLRKNIVDLCARLKGIEGVEEIGMTTNGVLLKRKLERLVNEGGINTLNISLDTLDENKFMVIARRNGFKHVYDSILEAAKFLETKGTHSLKKVKINCVVQRGVNDDELEKFVGLTESLGIEVRFIEFMPFDGNKWKRNSTIMYDEMLSILRKKYPTIARAKGLDGENAVSKVWHIPGFSGSVGFITSMSQHFCGSCNRLRLTCDGNLKPCLFGNEEVSLLSPLRGGASDEELEEIILRTVMKKQYKLGGHNSPEEISLGKNRSMVRIGG